MKASLPPDPHDSEMHIYEKLRRSEEYACIPDEELIALVRACLGADARYIEVAKVLDGGYYDDEDAYSMILEVLTGDFPERRNLLAAFVDDYMEQYEAYLEGLGMIEWE